MWIKHLSIFSRRRRQDVVIVTGFGGAVDDSLDIVEGKGYAANDSTREAWVVDDENMLVDRKSGRLIQLITAWSTMPVRMFGDAKTQITSDNVDALAARVTDESIEWEFDRQRRNSLIMWGGIVATILAVGILVPVLMAVLQGKLRVPFLG